MSITITYTCDRCGRSWERPDGYDPDRKLFAIEVKVEMHTYWKTVQWCRTCVDHFKVFSTEPAPVNEVGPGMKTASERLEELIREIAGGMA